ncbi:MAG: hypothetical protein HKP61_13390 [Dactylosporangium sp.]|nr:hypothetical protein [Dactylosporangium sp.]NNJ61909.1 hypothetical protein [Dactylosporangium sp.]
MLTSAVRGTALSVFAVVAAIVVPTPAQADPFQNVYCDVNPVPGCIVRIIVRPQPGDDGSTGNNGGSGNGGNGDGALEPGDCYVQRLPGQESTPIGGPMPGAWYERICLLPGGGEAVSAAFWLTDDQVISPATVARQAVARLTLPTLVLRWNPAPPADQILYIPTWLWVDSVSWVPQSATASVPGLSVTATATPTRVVFATGDGNSVTCDGPGTAWQSGMDPLSASPTCGYTYPAPGAYTLTATVTWTVTWAGGGTSGTVDPLTTSASQQVRVVEAGAVNTNGV